MFGRATEEPEDLEELPPIVARRPVTARVKRKPGSGPYDVDEPEAAALQGGLDFGSLRVPMPARAQLQVEHGSGELLRAVHVLVPSGRVSLSALAAPRTSPLWRELATEIADSLAKDGARVRSEWGEWGREVEAGSKGALSRFIGVDGPRWMLYGVATGPAEGAAELAETLREMMRGTVVTRGPDPLPVKTVLPLRLPEHLEERVEQARGESARRPSADPTPATADPVVPLDPAARAVPPPAAPPTPPVPPPSAAPVPPRSAPPPATPPPVTPPPATPSGRPSRIGRPWGAEPPVAPATPAARPPVAPAVPPARTNPPYQPPAHQPAAASYQPGGGHSVGWREAAWERDARRSGAPRPGTGVPGTGIPAAPSRHHTGQQPAARHPGAQTPAPSHAVPARPGYRRGLPPIPAASPLDTNGVPRQSTESTWTFARPVVSAEQVAQQPAWAQLSDAPAFWPETQRGGRGGVSPGRPEYSPGVGRSPARPSGRPEPRGPEQYGPDPRGHRVPAPPNRAALDDATDPGTYSLPREPGSVAGGYRPPPAAAPTGPPPAAPTESSPGVDSGRRAERARGRTQSSLIDSTDALHLALTMDSAVTQDRLPRVERRRRQRRQD